MREIGVWSPVATGPSRKNRSWQLHCQTLGNRCECHGSSEMTIINGRPVSQWVWHVKEPSLLNGQHRSFAALHRQCWRLHISEKSSSGTINPKQIKSKSKKSFIFYFFTHAFWKKLALIILVQRLHSIITYVGCSTSLSVPHLLWPGASVYKGYFRGLSDTHTCCRAFGSWAVSTSFHDLRLSWRGFEHPTFRCGVYALTDCATIVVVLKEYSAECWILN